jgi:hypothetical protein
MTFYEYAKFALAVLGSIGSGGAIVLSMSGYLGKIWADRALQNERHKYDLALQEDRHRYEQMNLHLQQQLNTLSKIHDLRLTQEFTHVDALWKSVTALIICIDTNYGDLEKDEVWTAMMATRQPIANEVIFIPIAIAIAAEELLDVVILNLQVVLSIDDVPEAGKERTKAKREMYQKFRDRRAHLQQLIRRYLNGEDLQPIEGSLGEATVHLPASPAQSHPTA